MSAEKSNRLDMAMTRVWVGFAKKVGSIYREIQQREDDSTHPTYDALIKCHIYAKLTLYHRFDGSFDEI